MNVLKICAAAILAIVGLTSTESAPCKVDQTLEDNKALVATALDALFNKRNVSAIDEYIGTPYLQHNPRVRDGHDELRSYFAMFPTDSKYELGSVAAEGDLVWTHNRYTGLPGLNVSITVDIFRVKDGKLVEHWDIAQEEIIASQTASGRPVFPIESSAPVPVIKGCGGDSTTPCESKELLDANKALVATALDALFNKRDVSAIDKYISPTFMQHNPLARDGRDELRSYFAMFPTGSKFELGSQVAEGDLVWSHCRYTGIPGLDDGVMIVVDIFRVKDGMLVEHWDVVQPEITQTMSGRPMFPIEA